MAIDGKRAKYFRILAWFKEQDELAHHRRANPNHSPLGGAGHGLMGGGTGTLEGPAPDFESVDWQSPSEPPKRARPWATTTVAPEHLCGEQRILEPFDISFIYGTGVALPTYERLEECMRFE